MFNICTARTPNKKIGFNIEGLHFVTKVVFQISARLNGEIIILQHIRIHNSCYGGFSEKTKNTLWIFASPFWLNYYSPLNTTRESSLTSNTSLGQLWRTLESPDFKVVNFFLQRTFFKETFSIIFSNMTCFYEILWYRKQFCYFPYLSVTISPFTLQIKKKSEYVVVLLHQVWD